MKPSSTHAKWFWVVSSFLFFPLEDVWNSFIYGVVFAETFFCHLFVVSLFFKLFDGLNNCIIEEIRKSQGLFGVGYEQVAKSKAEPIMSFGSIPFDVFYYKCHRHQWYNQKSHLQFNFSCLLLFIIFTLEVLIIFFMLILRFVLKLSPIIWNIVLHLSLAGM